MNFKVYIYDGETGEYWGREVLNDTSKIKEVLSNGYAVQVCDQKNNPLEHHKDKNIGTDSDGFAFTIKP